MNTYYQHKKTEKVFRVWETGNEVQVFRIDYFSYFDGLWETSSKEVEIGVFNDLEEAFEAMVNNN